MLQKKFFVHLEPEPGLVERPDIAVAVDRAGILHQLVAKLVRLRNVALEVAAVVDGGEEMDAGGVVEAGHRAVRMDGQLPRRGERGDAQRLGDAAGLGEVRLQDGDRAVLQHPVEFEASVVVLAGGERRAPVGACLTVAAVVVRRKRLLEPADAQLVHRGHHVAHIVQAIADIGVGENRESVAEFLARRAHPFDVAPG